MPAATVEMRCVLRSVSIMLAAPYALTGVRHYLRLEAEGLAFRKQRAKTGVLD